MFSSKFIPAITAILAVVPLQAQAATFLVTERAALGGNDLVNWASVGKVFNPSVFNPANFLPNSFSTTSEKGLKVNIDIAAKTRPFFTQPFIFQTLPPPGIRTNFGLGDYVLFGGIDFRGFGPPPTDGSDPLTNGNPGPFTITFEKPVRAAGAQIAVDVSKPNIPTFISAFDQDNNLLSTFSVLSSASLLLDNSAVFLGVASDTANIAKIVFSSAFSNAAPNETQYGLAINQLSIATPVPESSYMLGILSMGLLGVVWRLHKLNLHLIQNNKCR